MDAKWGEYENIEFSVTVFGIHKAFTDCLYPSTCWLFWLLTLNNNLEEPKEDHQRKSQNLLDNLDH